jgi:hypothetical protein
MVLTSYKLKLFSNEGEALIMQEGKVVRKPN